MKYLFKLIESKGVSAQDCIHFKSRHTLLAFKLLRFDLARAFLNDLFILGNVFRKRIDHDGLRLAMDLFHESARVILVLHRKGPARHLVKSSRRQEILETFLVVQKCFEPQLRISHKLPKHINVICNFND